MNADQAQALRDLVRRADVAALGTLHRGEPFVSMVPYALLPDGAGFVIHVSRLATHTRDMEEHAGVSLLVLGERGADAPAQALPRATLQGEARVIARDDVDYSAARQAYVTRFPASEDMFGFGDFSLFRIVPRSVRFVGGFAQAWSATADDCVRALSGAA